MQQKLHDRQCVKASAHIIQYDAETLREAFQLTYRRRLDDVKPSKKYKAREQRFPRRRSSDQGNELSGHFVNDHKLRIFVAGCPRNLRGGRYADEDDQSRDCASRQRLTVGRDPMCQHPPA